MGKIKMNFGKSSSNFFRGRTMKNIFNNKSSFKFTSSQSFHTKNTINFCNSYFLFNLRNIINVSKSVSSFQISKMILGSNKNIGEEQDEISYSNSEQTGNAINSINEFSMILKRSVWHSMMNVSGACQVIVLTGTWVSQCDCI